MNKPCIVATLESMGDISITVTFLGKGAGIRFIFLSGALIT